MVMPLLDASQSGPGRGDSETAKLVQRDACAPVHAAGELRSHYKTVCQIKASFKYDVRCFECWEVIAL